VSRYCNVYVPIKACDKSHHRSGRQHKTPQPGIPGYGPRGAHPLQPRFLYAEISAEISASVSPAVDWVSQISIPTFATVVARTRRLLSDTAHLFLDIAPFLPSVAALFALYTNPTYMNAMSVSVAMHVPSIIYLACHRGSATIVLTWFLCTILATPEDRYGDVSVSHNLVAAAWLVRVIDYMGLFRVEAATLQPDLNRIEKGMHEVRLVPSHFCLFILLTFALTSEETSPCLNRPY